MAALLIINIVNWSQQCIYSQSISKKFDITFQLISEIKNINKPCLPCGRIGNKVIDSINQVCGVAYCNKVRIAKNPVVYCYYIKFNSNKRLDTIVTLYNKCGLVKNIAYY